MQYYTVINQHGINSLIENAKSELFMCMPSIHEEVGDAILRLANNDRDKNVRPSIHLLIDYDAQTFRQGYGDHQSIERLIKQGIDVKTLKDNRVSFIIVDDIGYYLFIESRSLIPADKETVNAVRIDPVSIVRLKKYFFSGSTSIDFQDELTNAIIEESKQLEKANKLVDSHTAHVTEIESQKFEAVKEDLKNNPPIKPDYKRIVDFYSNKFQYVKLSFDGSGLKHRKIEIPPDVLPILDVRLKRRLETKLNLFDDENIDEAFPEFNKLKSDIKQLREDFLTKIKSRDESLLDKSKKAKFQEKLELLDAQLLDVKKSTMKNISTRLDKTKTNLLDELQVFFEINPKSFMPKNIELWQNETDYIRNQAFNKASELILKLKWPKPHELVEEFKFNTTYSDITYEDLKNKDFINELKQKGLITSIDSEQLANFGRGVRV